MDAEALERENTFEGYTENQANCWGGVDPARRRRKNRQETIMVGLKTQKQRIISRQEKTSGGGAA